MLRNTFSLILILFTVSAANAQVVGLPKKVIMFMTKQQPTAKTSNQAYRLIAETRMQDDGGGIDFTDSTTYVYQNSGNTNVDSSYAYQYIGGVWEPQGLDVTEYDGNGRPVKFKGFYFAGPGWELESRGVGTYDANGNLLTMVYEEYNGTTWDTTVKFVNTYLNNRLSEEMLYADQGGGLEPVVKTNYRYNAQGLEDTVESQMYFGGWVGTEKNTYTYNAAGKVLVHTAFDGDFMGGWDANERISYSYNQRNDLVVIIKEQWNGTTWQNSSRTDYQVGTDGVVTDYLVSVWNGTDWQEDRQVIYTYTGALVDSMLEQVKNNNIWVNANSTAYTYDAHGNETVVQSYIWNNNSWTLDNENRKYYQAYTSTGIVNPPAYLEGLSVYPNPVETVATFTFTTERDCMAALAIYDLTGRQLFAIGLQATAGQNTMHWDTGSMPAGSYIYKIKADGKVASGLLVK